MFVEDILTTMGPASFRMVVSTMIEAMMIVMMRMAVIMYYRIME